GTAVLQLERFKQQSLCLVYPAPGATDERDHEAANALASILGGSNSRFFWNIIQAGVAPVAGAWRVDYCDTGLMVLCGFCGPARSEVLLEAIRREADKVMREGVTEDELQRVKNRRRTSLVTEAESPYYRLVQLADDVDTYGRPRTVEERMERLAELTPGDIGGDLGRWASTGDGYLGGVGPGEWPGDGRGGRGRERIGVGGRR